MASKLLAALIASLFVASALAADECPIGEEFQTCGTACPATCVNYDKEVICTQQCVVGCFCPSGKVRNDAGLCVDPQQCQRVRPCPDKSTSCVGKFIAANSDCSREGLTSKRLDPLTIAHTRVDASFFNATGSFYNYTITGLSNYTIKDFFYNNSSKQAVLTHNFPAFTINGYLTYNVLAVNEEIVSYDNQYTFLYKDVTISTIFKDYRDIDLSTSVSIAYLSNIPTDSQIGRGFAPKAVSLAAQYPEVQDFLNQRKLHPDIFAVEVFKSRVPAIAHAYINSVLCNFE